LGPFAVVVIQLSRIIRSLAEAAAQSREELSNLLQLITRVKPFFLIPRSTANSLRLSLARNGHPLRTAANYLNLLPLSIGKDWPELK
jgi:predicted RNase H-like nuclease